ncbi:MAG TPA: glycosyltransferase family 1 protein [Flavitalea sp.]|nr:glycosyltransferase family 1 protein [Flavitalea sp.]
MKIGIEAQRLFRPGKHGMEVVALELIRRLPRLDKKNEYLLFVKKDTDMSGISELPNLSIRYISSLTYADWEQAGLPLALKKNKPDLVHCMANTAPLICPAPLILTLHDVIYLENTNFGGSAYQNLGNLYRRAVVPRAIRQARLIITVSMYEKNIIAERCKTPADKIRVVYNGVDERFHPDHHQETAEAFRRKYLLPEAYILFLGNTAPKKNTQAMARAYTEYCDNCEDALPLVITDYARRHVEQLLREQNKMHLMDKFIFPGYIPIEEMPLLYHHAQVFVYPSLRESFGLPMLEAMASGVPVVASNASAIPEIAGDAALLVDPHSYKEIAQGIAKMAADEHLRAVYRQKGFERARLFSWENSARQLLDIYNGI